MEQAKVTKLGDIANIITQKLNDKNITELETEMQLFEQDRIEYLFCYIKAL